MFSIASKTIPNLASRRVFGSVQQAYRLSGKNFCTKASTTINHAKQSTLLSKVGKSVKFVGKWGFITAAAIPITALTAHYSLKLFNHYKLYNVSHPLHSNILSDIARVWEGCERGLVMISSCMLLYTNYITYDLRLQRIKNQIATVESSLNIINGTDDNIIKKEDEGDEELDDNNDNIDNIDNNEEVKEPNKKPKIVRKIINFLNNYFSGDANGSNNNGKANSNLNYTFVEQKILDISNYFLNYLQQNDRLASPFDDRLVELNELLNSNKPQQDNNINIDEEEDSKVYLEKLGIINDNFKKEISASYERDAIALFNVIIGLGGVVVKFGQELSLLNGLIPDEYCKTMRLLRNRVPSIAFEEVNNAFLEEFGVGVDELFSSFHHTPFAAASLAQVHKAVTKEGREVAVKIQYPLVKRFLEADLLANKIVAKCIVKVNKDFKYNEELADHMAAQLKKELNFINEAENAMKCRDNFKNNLNFYVPDTILSLSSKKILTMELITDALSPNKEQLEKHNISTKEVATLIFEALAEQMFSHGFVHSDPHPGNIFVRKIKLTNNKYDTNNSNNNIPDNEKYTVLPIDDNSKDSKIQVVLLDHGLYCEYDKLFAKQFATLWESLIVRNDKLSKEICDLWKIKHYDLFATLILMQRFDSIQVGKAIPDLEKDPEKFKTEMRKYVKLHRTQMQRWMEMSESLPKEIHLILRSAFIARMLNVELGCPVNRFLITTRIASLFSNEKASLLNSIDYINQLEQNELNNNLQNNNNNNTMLSRYNANTSLTSRLLFEIRIAYYYVQAWLAQQAIRIYDYFYS